MIGDHLGDFAHRLRDLLNDGLAEAGGVRRRALLLDAAGNDRRCRRLVGALAALLDGPLFSRLAGSAAGCGREDMALRAAAELHDLHGFDLLVGCDAAWVAQAALGEAPAKEPPAAADGTSGTPRVLVVDAMGRGDFTSLAAAIAASRSGGRIVVLPGLYRESVTIDKPLEIRGEPAGGKVVVMGAGNGGACIRLQAVAGRLENLVVVGASDLAEAMDGIAIDGGTVFIHGCQCSGGCGLRAGNGAFISVTGSVFGDCRTAGMMLEGGVIGVVENNDIGAGGVCLSGKGTSPDIRGNRLRGALAIGWGAAPVVEDNDITGSGDYGVDVWAMDRFNQKQVTCPTIRGNRISGNRMSGVFVHRGAAATIENNDITGNGEAGVEIGDPGTSPLVRGNRICGNQAAAVWLRDGASVTLDGNDLSGNKGGSSLVEAGTTVHSLLPTDGGDRVGSGEADFGGQGEGN